MREAANLLATLEQRLPSVGAGHYISLDLDEGRLIIHLSLEKAYMIIRLSDSDLDKTVDELMVGVAREIKKQLNGNIYR